LKQGEEEDEEEEEEEEEGGGKAPPPPRRIKVGVVAEWLLPVEEVEKGEADLLLLLLLLRPPTFMLRFMLIAPRRARAAAEEGVVSRRGVERPAARGEPRLEPSLRTERSLGIILFAWFCLVDEDGGRDDDGVVRVEGRGKKKEEWKRVCACLLVVVVA